MTVTSYLRYLGELRGMARRDLDGRLPEVIARCQLAGQTHRVIEELSHGYRKRVGIAQAIIHRPRVVILDEPISGLDPVQIVEMRKVIRSLGDEATVLVSSHILPEVSETCHRILVLRKGRLIADGTEEQLSERFQGGSVIRITVAGESEKVVRTLQGVASVKSVTAQGGRPDRPVFLVEMTGDHRENVVAALVSAGLGLRRLDDMGGELEDIFMGLNQEGAA
jgi:ABC-2 type transport system ATP-binding protein